jgi:exodeoxyribonuclease-3
MADKDQNNIRVITWNVNSVNARLERILPFLKRARPSIIGLQELKCLDDKFPGEAFKELGYHFVTFGQKTYNGVAILSLNPLKDVQCGFGDPEARFIAATTYGLRIHCLYAPNGQALDSPKYVYKLDWYKKVATHLKETVSSKTPAALLGDFNVAPEDRDVHDPVSWAGQVLCSDLERTALKNLIALGYEDTFRKHHSEGGLFSWWDYRQLGFVKNHGLRIDFVLATPPLMKRCTGAWIEREERKGTGPSDHAPVVAEFSDA